jgi:hypothetical protein
MVVQIHLVLYKESSKILLQKIKKIPFAEVYKLKTTHLDQFYLQMKMLTPQLTKNLSWRHQRFLTRRLKNSSHHLIKAQTLRISFSKNVIHNHLAKEIATRMKPNLILRKSISPQ